MDKLNDQEEEYLDELGYAVDISEDELNISEEDWMSSLRKERNLREKIKTSLHIGFTDDPQLLAESVRA